MNSKQQQITIAMALSLLYSVLVFMYGGQLFSQAPDTQTTLAYIMTWLLLPATALLLGIGRLARTRFFDENLIDGDPPETNSKAEIDARYLQNTLEQFVLAAPVFIALGLLLPKQELPLIAALCSNFLLMRILFWIGYQTQPQLRAIGFAGTFYPTVGALIYAAWLAVQ